MRRELCVPCAVALKEAGEELRCVSAGRNKKVTCAQCGRRRFGAEYEIARKRRLKRKEAAG